MIIRNVFHQKKIRKKTKKPKLKSPPKLGEKNLICTFIYDINVPCHTFTSSSFPIIYKMKP